jgi:UDP-N-acetylmuramate--alanine ligase
MSPESPELPELPGLPGPRESPELPGLPEPERSRFHYAGVAGGGMSALAQFQAMVGGTATGSDRTFDRGGARRIRRALERAGVRIFPQDGSGIDSATDGLVVSTAVEETVPDVRAARAAGVPIFHRSELLAHLVDTRRTVAVAGTSGKSTVVAMIFELLRGAGLDPALVTGAELLLLEAEGYLGNAWVGASDLLIVEADESDGSLVRYAPAIGVLLNLEKDHKEMAEVRAMFGTFRSRSREAFVVGEGANLAHLRPGALVFGTGEAATSGVRAVEIRLRGETSEFTVDGIPFQVPLPGIHNVENALAAIATGRALGLTLPSMAPLLARLQGVARRLQSIGTARGILVVDDFAHNPSKLRAAIAAARLRKPGRLLAVYQPHGFGPTRFLRDELTEAFRTSLEPADRLWLLEIFYAGGTTTKDISSADLVTDLRALDVAAEFAPDRPALISRLAESAVPGDLILVMGARDPSLTDLLGSGAPWRRIGAASCTMPEKGGLPCRVYSTS